PQSGSTAPITLAGFLAQQNAEILSSFVIAYSASEKGRRPPVIYGTAPAIFDQRYGTMVYSCPEGMLLNAASIQIARFYGFPSRGTAGVTESKDVDMQAGFEAGMSLLTTALAGCNLIMNAGGGMMGPGVDIVSLEKAIIDSEIVSYVDRFLKAIDVNEEELAFEAIKETGPEGHYLKSKHTLKNLSKYRPPKIVDRKPTSRWLNEKKSLREKARETVNKILKEHQPEPLDKGVENEIRKLIEEERRKRLQLQ
ncbi:MAG: trimethylamine methyltransferase family protein, partial [Candidatus Methanomethylicia archaeon]